MSGTATLKMHTKLAFGENPAAVVRLTLIFTIANGRMVSRLQSFIEPKCQEWPPFKEKEHWPGQ